MVIFMIQLTIVFKIFQIQSRYEKIITVISHYYYGSNHN
jgi:hypothetical protein